MIRSVYRLIAPFRTLWAHRLLIAALVARDVSSRYQSSALGLLWCLMTPFLMLSLYTWVFSVVFRARWAAPTAPPDAGTAALGVSAIEVQSGVGAEFVVLVFIGLAVHGLVAEVATQSPTLMAAHANYVTKIVFPIDVLSAVTVGSALVHFSMASAVMVGFVAAVGGGLPVTALWGPVVIAPLLLITLGVSWMLAAIGVYARDIRQVIGPCVTALMFLSPVFYALETLPDSVRPYLVINPLTPVIENLRLTIVWGRHPEWVDLAVWMAVGIVVLIVGHLMFQWLRRGFADVL